MGGGQMANVIRFPRSDNEYSNASDFLQDSILRLAEDGVESVLIAGKTKDGQVVTGYYKCDFGLKQELCGHIQCDIIDLMIRSNPDRYGG
jgi:hypothetical protein